jgi:hypothetical protein
MKRYSFAHLAGPKVLLEYDAVESRENGETATAIALLGEIEARKLYVPAGYSSMFAYCLGARHMSEDRANKRLRVARAARVFPGIYDAIAEGRLHLTALFLLAPHLTPANVDTLLAAATHKTRAQVELLIAERFPKADVAAEVWPIPSPAPATTPPVEVEQVELKVEAVAENLPVPGQVVPSEIANSANSMAPVPGPRPKVAPLAAERFGIQFTIDKATHDRLRNVQALLGPGVPNSDLAKVFALALECLEAKLEKRKFGKTSRPGRRRGSKNPRYVSPAIQRAVYERDGGQCTFVGTGGKRCEARETLEYDHVDPVARGGRATVSGIRLLCRTHNQYAAECTFGTEFMQAKRLRETPPSAATTPPSASHSAPPGQHGSC